MCGFFGIFQLNSETEPDRDKLALTAKMLSHRGPDSSGIYADSTVGFVHTRLSLLDLSSRSNQPFWDSQQRYCLLYNGEIYNFQQLRLELENKGVRFRTTSDTEVVLECLLHDGVRAAVEKLEGMFAFALYDKQNQSLVLGRDCFGIKPLYIYQSDSEIIFSSEIMAMKHWLSFQPDSLSVISYLQGFTQPTEGHSFYRDIKIFPTGTVFYADKTGTPRQEPYFRIMSFWDESLREKYRNYSPDAIVDEVEQKLLESVNMQLVADIPVGGLCSGGLDSSLILAMAAKSHSNLAVFHADVVGPGSEFAAARMLADHLKLDMKVVRVTDQDYLDDLPVVTEHYGHPFFRHPNSVPFYQVAKLIRENEVKAVLSGEGADECYIGYPWDIYDFKSTVARTLQSPLKALGRLTTRWCQKAGAKMNTNLAADFGNRFEYQEQADSIRKQLQLQNSLFTTTDLRSLELINYHLRTLLHRNDALGMASSVEARFPLLDRELVRLAINMPSTYKVRFSWGARDPRHYFLHDKWVLRKVAERYLPGTLAWRFKCGFPVDTFSRMHIAGDFFRYSLVRDFLQLTDNQMDYLLENSSQQMRIRLLHLEVWMHCCLYHEPRQAILKRLHEHIAIGEKRIH